jgi:hypothetical protein
MQTPMSVKHKNYLKAAHNKSASQLQQIKLQISNNLKHVAPTAKQPS